MFQAWSLAKLTFLIAQDKSDSVIPEWEKSPRIKETDFFVIFFFPNSSSAKVSEGPDLRPGMKQPSLRGPLQNRTCYSY